MTYSMACATLRVGFKVIIRSTTGLKANKRYGVVVGLCFARYERAYATVQTPVGHMPFDVYWLEHPETPKAQYTAKRLAGT